MILGIPYYNNYIIFFLDEYQESESAVCRPGETVTSMTAKLNIISKSMIQLILLVFLFAILSLTLTNAFRHVKPSILARSKLFMSTATEVLTKDGGVVKELLAVGKGRSIETGDILAVEYAAYLAGSKTPFALGEKEKFTFKGSLNHFVRFISYYHSSINQLND